jgi:hypothetical protein
MYTYPNPLNSKLPFFHHRFVLVVKAVDAQRLRVCKYVTDHIERVDIYGNRFLYEIVDMTVAPRDDVPDDDCSEVTTIPTHTDIFRACKDRE